jgi:hypothetical protein
MNAAEKAGLRGTVIPVWFGMNSRKSFQAPTELRPLLGGITFIWVKVSVNAAFDVP